MTPKLTGLIAIFCITLWPVAQASAPNHADKSAIIEAAARHLETDYVEAEKTGLSSAKALRADLNAGVFDNAQTGEAFAEQVSQRLQALTGDGHLNIEYAKTAIDMKNETETAFTAEAMQRWYGAGVNYGVDSVERLDGNIGYLDLRVFAPLDMGGQTIAAAMTVVADLDALIIDLRHNGGGMADTADFVASYLFATERQPLTGTYDRPSDTLTQRFTQPFVPGKRFGPNKPVYILISKRTFSAAEALAYNLQALDRAVIVGEVSGGGAHPFEYVPIHPHFVLWSVTAKSVNPVTGENWQSVGVQPDIVVKSADALALVLQKLQSKQAD